MTIITANLTKYVMNCAWTEVQTIYIWRMYNLESVSMWVWGVGGGIGVGGWQKQWSVQIPHNDVS